MTLEAFWLENCREYYSRILLYPAIRFQPKRVTLFVIIGAFADVITKTYIFLLDNVDYVKY